ncbi:CheY-like chemotaxis protein [Mucilaginibacter sp. UYNi724]
MITNTQPTRIYVIDDEPLDNMIIKMLIKRVDGEINVDTINNGAGAIEKLIKVADTNVNELPDYIFLDLNMPEMNGWEFLREYERLKLLKKIQIYILSSSIYREDMDKSKCEPLVEDFINKPLNLEHLRNILKAA